MHCLQCCLNRVAVGAVRLYTGHVGLKLRLVGSFQWRLGALWCRFHLEWHVLHIRGCTCLNPMHFRWGLASENAKQRQNKQKAKLQGLKQRHSQPNKPTAAAVEVVGQPTHQQGRGKASTAAQVAPGVSGSLCAAQGARRTRRRWAQLPKTLESGHEVSHVPVEHTGHCWKKVIVQTPSFLATFHLAPCLLSLLAYHSGCSNSFFGKDGGPACTSCHAFGSSLAVWHPIGTLNAWCDCWCRCSSARPQTDTLP